MDNESPMGDKSDNMDEPDGMGNSMNNNEGGSDDSTIDIINKLSDTDREAVRAYAESSGVWAMRVG